MRRLLVLFALLLPACGGVRPVDIHDPRLPRADRLFLADAEDAVVVARAAVADAEDRLEDVQRWRARIADAGSLGAADGALQAMAAARVRLARLELDAAEAHRDLSAARLTRAYARTAMRRDLAVYELAPIDQAAEAAAARASAARDAVDQQRIALQEATTAFWQAFRQLAASGGDTRPLWRE